MSSPPYAPPIQLEGLVQAHFQPRPLAEHLLLSLTASLDDPRKALAGKSVHLRERFYHKVNSWRQPCVPFKVAAVYCSYLVTVGLYIR